MSLVIERVTGRVTTAPRVNEVDGKPVVNFSLAINERYKTRAGELKEETTYIDCSLWNRPNVSEYITKGALIEVSGRLKVRAFMAASNEPRGVFHLTVLRLKFHTSNKSQPSTAAGADATENAKQNGSGKKSRYSRASTKKIPATVEEVTEPIDDLPF